LTEGKITYTTTFDSVKFSNGSRILSLPSSTDGSNLRGYSAQCVCIDEGAFIPHLDSILNAINPTLTRDKNAELIFTTTPAGQNSYFFKEIYQKGKFDDDWYVQETTIYDAINDGLDIEVESLKSLCPDEDIFQQEYECKFLSEYGSLIDTSLIDFYDEVLPTGTYYFGMDVGSKNDRSAIIIAKQLKDITFIEDIIVLNKVSYEN
jgi:phage FluMu gp28-like protein